MVVDDLGCGLIHGFFSGVRVSLPTLTRKQTSQIIYRVLQSSVTVTSIIKQQRWTRFFLVLFEKNCISRFNTCDLQIYTFALLVWVENEKYFMQFLLQASEFGDLCKSVQVTCSVSVEKV